MSKDVLHKNIINKFGTITKFSKLAKLDRYELQKMFARKHNSKDDLDRINRLIKDTNVGFVDSEISEQQLKKLTKLIIKQGGIPKFCKETGFPKLMIYQILQGRRKRITGRVRDLFDHLSIK